MTFQTLCPGGCSPESHPYWFVFQWSEGAQPELLLVCRAQQGMCCVTQLLSSVGRRENCWGRSCVFQKRSTRFVKPVCLLPCPPWEEKQLGLGTSLCVLMCLLLMLGGGAINGRVLKLSSDSWGCWDWIASWGVLSWAARCAMVRLWVPVVTNDHPSTSLRNTSCFSIICFSNILLRTASWDGKNHKLSV